MSKVLEELRMAREAKGYSLEEVQRQTQVKLHYLEAIEKGDFAALPGSFYGRAFIRAYAQCVEVDPEPILQLYAEEEKRRHASSTTEEGQSLRRSERHDSEREVKKRALSQTRAKGTIPGLFSKWYTWVSVAVVILMIPLAIYLLGGFQKDSQTVDSAAPEEREEANEAEASDVEKDPSEDPEITKTEVNYVKSDPSYPYGDIVMIQHADEVEVVLEAKGDGWFRLRNGGPEEPITKEENFTAGYKEVFKHPNWISLRLSRPDMVKITVNGTVIATEDMKQAQTFQFKLDK